MVIETLFTRFLFEIFHKYDVVFPAIITITTITA